MSKTMSLPELEMIALEANTDILAVPNVTQQFCIMCPALYVLKVRG